MTSFSTLLLRRQTAFSGNDDNSAFLSYEVGAIQVFLNGILLDPETDYTATNSTLITLVSAAAVDDYLQIFSFKKKISGGNVTVDSFSGNNSTTAFTLSIDPGDENNTRVFVDGVYQSKASYTVSGTTLTFSTAPPSGTAIEVESGNRSVTIPTTENLDFPDNVKLRLGTSQDLEVYHNATDSVINQTGTGDLLIQKDETTVAEFNVEGLTVTGSVEADEFIGDVRGAVLFKAQAGESLAKGEVVYISGISGNTTIVSKADADDASKMPAFGLVAAAASSGNPVDIYTNGILSGIDTSSYSEGDELFVSTTAGALTATPPTGESSALQKIGKVTRSASNGSIFIVGAGRSNAVSNLDDGDIFIGNSSNQAVSASLNTKIESYLDGGTSTPTFSTINSGNITTTGELRGPASFTIDPAAVGDNTGTVIIKGNLQVDGATTTINSTTLTVDDLNLTLASGAANGTAANGAGITIDGASATLTYASAGDNWAFNKNLDVTGNIVVSGTVDGVDIAARDAVLTSTTTTAGAALPKAGGTMTGNLNLGDDIKAQFGADNDLQIYHSGNHSYINDSGTGNLYLGGSDLIWLGSGDLQEAYATFNDDGAVTLRHDNSIKFATTSTGIDVTGTADVTLDLNVGGAVKGNAGTRAVSVGVAGSVVGGLQLWSTTAGTSYVQFGDEAGTAANHYRGYMSYSHANDSMALGTSGNTKVTVSSAGNVGIGVVPKVWHSSTAVLQIGSGGSLEASTTNESRVFLQANAYRNASNVQSYLSTDEASQYWQNAGKHIFEVAPSGTADAAISWTTAMTIDNSGNVGIGTDSPAAKLHIENGDMRIEKDTKATIGFRGHTTGSTALAFRDSNAGVDRMTIDSSGKVGIGTSSPGEELHIETTGGATAGIQLSTTGGTVDRDWKFLATAAAGTFFIQDATASVNRVAIDTSGNVGIGTTAPLGKLHVRDGSAQAGISHTYIYDGSSISVEATEPSIQLMAEDAGTHGGSLLWRYGNNTFAAIANPTTDAIDFTYGVATANDFQVHSGTNMSSYKKIMSIGGDGNVGIGTDDPVTALHVDPGYVTLGTSTGTDNSWINNVEDGNLELVNEGRSTNDGAVRINRKNNPAGDTTYFRDTVIYDGKSNVVLFVDGSEGSVGIGTDSPDYPLHISGTGSQRLRIQKTDAGGDADLQLYSPSDSTQWILFGDSTSGNNSGVIKYVHSTNKMHFRTNDVNDRLVISSDGNVGIGTDDPQNSLHVNSSTDQATIRLTSADNSFARIYFGDQSDGVRGRVEYDNNDDALIFGTNDVQEHVRIDAIGNVGIGTDAPTEKLEVSGTAKAEQYLIDAISESNTDTAVDVFVYDTRKDSDGGAWRKRTQHTSWYNETLNTSTRGARKEFPSVAVIVAKRLSLLFMMVMILICRCGWCLMRRVEYPIYTGQLRMLAKL